MRVRSSSVGAALGEDGSSESVGRTVISENPSPAFTASNAQADEGTLL